VDQVVMVAGVTVRAAKAVVAVVAPVVARVRAVTDPLAEKVAQGDADSGVPSSLDQSIQYRHWPNL
jgi:hypothetical protein